jgi:hypothetical protein
MKNIRSIAVASFVFFNCLTLYAKSNLFTLEVNSGPVDFSLYARGGGSDVAGCDANRSYRSCFQAMLSNYASQGVTGIRFMFDLNTPTGPLASDGSLNSTWLEGLNLAFSDIKNSGIRDITITPSWANWGHGQVLTVHDDCKNTDKAFKFYRTSPIPYEVDTDYPYNEVGNLSYKCAPKNPIFIGWNNIYNVFSNILSQAQSAKLNVEEFDVVNEINVFWFSIHARFIYDNMHASSGDLNVYGHMRNLMAQFGFKPGSVTYSVASFNVTQTNFDCKSAYGDSARIVGSSALLAAISGKPFGEPSGFTSTNALVCGGVIGANGATLPTAQNLPDITDFHSYNCVNDSNVLCDSSKASDIASDTLILYNGIQDFLTRHLSADAIFMLGETHSMIFKNGSMCEGNNAPTTAASQQVQALADSRLSHTSGRSPASTVVRPWNNIASPGCYTINQQLDSAYVDSSQASGYPPPVIDAASSYAYPNAVISEHRSYVTLKGFAFSPNSDNIVTSNCSMLEKVYDGKDGAGKSAVTQINVRVEAHMEAQNCWFKIMRPSDQVTSAPITLSVAGLNLLPPKILSGSSDDGECASLNLIVQNYYSALPMEVWIRDANWTIRSQVKNVNLDSSDQISFSLSLADQSTLARGGLRVTVVNPAIKQWDTSEVIRCSKPPKNVTSPATP